MGNSLSSDSLNCAAYSLSTPRWLELEFVPCVSCEKELDAAATWRYLTWVSVGTSLVMGCVVRQQVATLQSLGRSSGTTASARLFLKQTRKIAQISLGYGGFKLAFGIGFFATIPSMADCNHFYRYNNIPAHYNTTGFTIYPLVVIFIGLWWIWRGSKMRDIAARSAQQLPTLSVVRQQLHPQSVEHTLTLTKTSSGKICLTMAGGTSTQTGQYEIVVQDLPRQQPGGEAGPAEQAGMAVGDEVTSVMGMPTELFKDVAAVLEFVHNAPVGAPIPFTVLRPSRAVVAAAAGTRRTQQEVPHAGAGAVAVNPLLSQTF